MAIHQQQKRGASSARLSVKDRHASIVSCDKPLEIAPTQTATAGVPVTVRPRNHFQLHRHAKRQTRDTVHTADRVLLCRNVLQQLRCGIRDFRLLAYVAKRGD